MEFFGKHRLVPHAQMRPKAVRSVDVKVVRGSDVVLLRYSVEPAASLLLPAFGRERRDNLWEGTCFGLFVQPESGGYVEFNFAPLSAWNAYSYVDWRMGRRPFQPQLEPRLIDSRLDDSTNELPARYTFDVILGKDVVSLAPARASLAAIVEDEDGAKSYWALAHPTGDPNFHHPDGFVARLA